MRKTLVAVFGHYDSRGGTTAIPINHQTVAEIKEAVRKYNTAFSWESMLADYRSNPDGWGWNPTEPFSSPGDDDFLFIAELYYPSSEDEGGVKVEEGIDLDQEPWAVLVEGGDGNKWPEAGFGPAQSGGRDDAFDYADATRIPPVRLEVVRRPTGIDEYEYGEGRSITGKNEKYEEALKARAFMINDPEVREWNDDAFGFLIAGEVAG